MFWIDSISVCGAADDYRSIMPGGEHTTPVSYTDEPSIQLTLEMNFTLMKREF
jgi:hypothetical protein